MALIDLSTRYGGTLATVHAHPRDPKITFVEEGHIYTIEGMPGHPVSVTTLIHKFFPEFDADMVIEKMMKGRNWTASKYYGKTKEEIKAGWNANGEEASRLGTLMHADIENYLNGVPVHDPDTVEFGYFMTFWTQFQAVNPRFVPYRTEWLVYDEDKRIAGSIDCVLSNSDNQIVILDWKRSKEIKTSNRFEKGYAPFQALDNCNYNHYRLQLNIYRHILETKYGQTVVGMFIVVFHPLNDSFVLFGMEPLDIAGIWDVLTAGGAGH